MANSQQFSKVQFGSETSTYGTEAGTYVALGRVQNIDLPALNNNIYDYGIGEGINATNTYYGPFDATGSVSFNVVDFTFLQHWVGSRTGSGTSGTPWLLTEAVEIEATTPALTNLVPFSIKTQNQDTETNVFFALGCVGTTFSLSGEINSVLSCEASFVGQKLKYDATNTESFTPDTDPAFVMINGTWKWGATPTAISGVRSFSLSYDNGLVGAGDETRTIESRFRTIPHLGQRVYTGEVTIIMASAVASTIITDFFGKTTGNVIEPEDGSTSISPTSSLEFHVDLVNGTRNAQLHVDEVSIDDISEPSAVGGGLVELSFRFTARKGSGNVPITWWTA